MNFQMVTFPRAVYSSNIIFNCCRRLCFYSKLKNTSASWNIFSFFTFDFGEKLHYSDQSWIHISFICMIGQLKFCANKHWLNTDLHMTGTNKYYFMRYLHKVRITENVIQGQGFLSVDANEPGNEIKDKGTSKQPRWHFHEMFTCTYGIFISYRLFLFVLYMIAYL